MLLVRKIGNHQMVATMPKMPTIKLFAQISLKAFCRSLVVAFVTASSVAPAMTIKRTAWARKMASFNAPSQICPVIKRFMSSAPKMKLPTQKTKIGDFKFKIAIYQLIKPFIFKFLVFFNRAKLVLQRRNDRIYVFSLLMYEI